MRQKDFLFILYNKYVIILLVYERRRNIIRPLTHHIIQMILTFALAYWVYRDGGKHQVRYKNIWVVLTAIFPPFALAYFIYSLTTARKAKLTKRQLVDMENRKRAEEHQKKIAAEREAMDRAREDEMKKNNMTLKEMEKIKQERVAAKKKRLQELEEERQYQLEENAKRLHMGENSASKVKANATN